MTKNILIISRCITDNLGDQAISKAMLSLAEELTSATVYAVDLTTEEHSNSQMYRFKHRLYKLISRVGGRDAAWRMENRGLFKILESVTFDLVLIGGGELVQSNSIFPLALDTWTQKIRNKQPHSAIYLFGVGVTSKFSQADREHIEKMLKRVNGVVVRDTASKDNLQSLYGINSTVIPDVVYSMQMQADDNNNEVRKGVLYGLTNWERIEKYGIYAESHEAYYQKTLAIISECVGEWELFYTTRNDYKECLRFREFASDHHVNIEISKYTDINSLIKLLKGKEKVYSPRMHGCIIADLCGCEVEPILISPKMESYKTTYKKPLDFDGMRTRIIDEMERIFKSNNII